MKTTLDIDSNRQKPIVIRVLAALCHPHVARSHRSHYSGEGVGLQAGKEYVCGPLANLYGIPWGLRILLAVTTGLRQQDIEIASLTAADVSTSPSSLPPSFRGPFRPSNRRIVLSRSVQAHRL